MKSLPTKKSHLLGAALFAAAMALPSYQSVFAEATPEKGVVAFKYLNYKDSQPGAERISVNAYTTSVMMPFAGDWSVASSYTYDSVSGASPGSYDVLSGASVGITEKRHAGDLSFTKYLEKGSLTFGGSFSTESDYNSKSFSLLRSVSTEDKNTTITFGGSYTSDEIDAYKKRVVDDKKSIFAGLIGISKILTKQDIVQLNIGFSQGTGYFSDPYKDLDYRPRKRNISTILTRWNHHFDGSDGTSKLGYRFYTDTYDIKAHTVSAEYFQPLPAKFTVIPSVRFSSQSAASFYQPVGTVLDYSLTDGIKPYSLDQRLSAFGALTLGIKGEKQVTENLTLDIKYEYYQQRPEWSITGKGDSGLKPFYFRSIQLGLSQRL